MALEDSGECVATITKPIELIVMGTSCGGLHALSTVLSNLPNDFSTPIIIVQHMAANADSLLVDILANCCAVMVSEANDKQPIEPNQIYIAPPGYHLMIEPDKSFTLTVDEKVQYCRPSIDILFESAAEIYESKLLAVLMTGANADGADGLKAVIEEGGTILVQDPSTAEVATMPKAGIEATNTHNIVPLERIAEVLIQACR